MTWEGDSEGVRCGGRGFGQKGSVSEGRGQNACMSGAPGARASRASWDVSRAASMSSEGQLPCPCSWLLGPLRSEGEKVRWREIGP